MNESSNKEISEAYAEQLAVQLRKGFLAFCVLKACLKKPKYSSDIIKQLREAELVVVEGTIYPLLSRLQKDGLLTHEWQESEQGPPRKYYVTTKYGQEVASLVQKKISALQTTLEKI
jgi:PadR family transcriptional regulator PadR